MPTKVNGNTEPQSENGTAEPVSEQQSETTVTSQPKYMTADEFNRAMTPFRKSFKELNDAIGKISNAAVPAESADKSQKPRDPEKEEMQQHIRTLLKEREDGKARERNLTLNETVSKNLLEAGVSQDKLRHAAAYLKAEHEVSFDEDGAMVMKLNGVPYDISTGIQEWSKTVDAKLYVSPKGTAGSGDKNKTAPVSAPVTDVRNAIAEAILKAQQLGR